MIMPVSEESELLKKVKEKLPKGKYDSVELCGIENTEAGTRACFRARWGNRSVFLKVDKTPKSENGKRHVEKGLNTAREVAISSLFPVDEALSHNISPVIDYVKDDEFIISSEPDFEGSQSLKRYMEKNRARKLDFINIFRQVLTAADYSTNTIGVYNRDMSPYNILVRKNGSLEVRLTDWTNAVKRDEPNEEIVSTAGKRIIRDPLLEGRFNEKNEIYSIAHDMLIYLTGEPAVKYDHINKNGKSFAGEDLVENGVWNKEKHDKTIATAIKKLPRWARKRYGKIIYKAMSSDSGYDTIEEFQKDFNKASKPSLLSRLKTETSAKLAAAGILGMLALVSVGLPRLQSHYSKNLEKAVSEASKQVIGTEFNGDSLEIINNLLNLKMTIYDKEGEEYLYNEGYGEIKKPDYIQLKPGQELTIYPYPHQIPLPREYSLAFPFFKGKCYIEGYPAIEFNTDSIIPDPSAYDDFGGPMLKILDFKVPENIPEGNYTLITEIYPQDKPDPPNTSTALKDIKYEEPKKALNRKRIPIVIGNPDDKMHLDSVRLDYSEFVDFRNLEKEALKENPNLMANKSIESKITYEVSIPELNFHKEPITKEPCVGSGHYFKASLPKPKDYEQRTLQIVVKQDGEIKGYTFMPIIGEALGPEGDKAFYWWEFDSPSPEFSDKLVKYREAIYKNAESHD